MRKALYTIMNRRGDRVWTIDVNEMSRLKTHVIMNSGPCEKNVEMMILENENKIIYYKPAGGSKEINIYNL